jgi:hypothetical protein
MITEIPFLCYYYINIVLIQLSQPDILCLKDTPGISRAKFREIIIHTLLFYVGNANKRKVKFQSLFWLL